MFFFNIKTLSIVSIGGVYGKGGILLQINLVGNESFAE
jgi:hypothetical protein